MPYGYTEMGQHWLRQWLTAWQHWAITWTNVDLLPVKSNDFHLRAISEEIPQPSLVKHTLKITYLKFHSNLPGANELISLQELTFPLQICINDTWNKISFQINRSKPSKSHLSSRTSRWRRPIPSISSWPPSMSTNRKSTENRLDFPDPVLPTMPTFSAGCVSKETLLRANGRPTR